MRTEGLGQKLYPRLKNGARTHVEGLWLVPWKMATSGGRSSRMAEGGKRPDVRGLPYFFPVCEPGFYGRPGWVANPMTQGTGQSLKVEFRGQVDLPGNRRRVQNCPQQEVQVSGECGRVLHGISDEQSGSECVEIWGLNSD